MQGIKCQQHWPLSLISSWNMTKGMFGMPTYICTAATLRLATSVNVSNCGLVELAHLRRCSALQDLAVQYLSSCYCNL